MIDAVILKAAQDIMNKRGGSAVYTPLLGDPVSCKVRLDHDVILQPSDYNAQVVETGSTIAALYSDVGDPKEGSTFVIDSTTYTVKRITDNDRIFVIMAVTEA